MSDLYSNTKVRELSEKLVRDDVIYSVSTLISKLANLDYDECKKLDIDYEGELMPLLEYVDWKAAADSFIDNMDRYDLEEYLTDNDIEFVAEEDDDGNPIDGATPTARLRATIKGNLDANDDYEEFCTDNDIEPERNEVYEHWIVSRWLSRKLVDKRESVCTILGLTVWGRTTTGQAISMDAVMLDIANDLLKETT